MNKNVLQILSFLALVILSAGITVQAQHRGSYHAQIPFDFTVGSKTYEAGEYVIRLSEPSGTASFLSFRKANGKEFPSSVAVMESFNTSRNGKTSLLFDKNGDYYALKQIVAPNFGFNTPKSKDKIRIAKNSNHVSETIAVELKSPESGSK
jgi:hypothetical protein